MKRYDCYNSAEESPGGEYVRYEDVANLLRGISLDPRVPLDLRSELRDMATELDGIKI